MATARRTATHALKKCDGTLEREHEVFYSRCAKAIAETDAMRRRLRFRRGLVVIWEHAVDLGVWRNTYGAGHLLMVAIRVHELCLQLRRYCYVRIYDSQCERPCPKRAVRAPHETCRVAADGLPRVAQTRSTLRIPTAPAGTLTIQRFGSTESHGPLCSTACRTQGLLLPL